MYYYVCAHIANGSTAAVFLCGRIPEGNKSHATIKGLWSFGVHTSTRDENATISSNSEHRRGWWESGVSAEKKVVFFCPGGEPTVVARDFSQLNNPYIGAT